MYERFYGLRERPFDLTSNPRFLFLSAKHREALSHLHYGISGSKGITVLIGEAGTGKTTLVRSVLEQHRDDQSCNVYVSNPSLTRNEFYEFLAWGFGLDWNPDASKVRFVIELTRALVERQKSGGASALIIDEAHCLPAELFEELRLLADIEIDSEKLLPVVLVGQPELADRLNEPSLRQLKQRVALRCVLPALDAGETALYIANRASVAGGDSDILFSAGATAAIFAHSHGIPRIISVICDNALVSGFAAGEKPVGRDTVLDVCRDFDLRPATAPPLSRAAAPSVAAAPPRESSFF